MSNSDYIKCRFCGFKVLKWRINKKGKKRGPGTAMEKVVLHVYREHMNMPEVKAMYEERMNI